MGSHEFYEYFRVQYKLPFFLVKKIIPKWNLLAFIDEDKKIKNACAWQVNSLVWLSWKADFGIIEPVRV
jgi:hypothetical protein